MMTTHPNVVECVSVLDVCVGIMPGKGKETEEEPVERFVAPWKEEEKTMQLVSPAGWLRAQDSRFNAVITATTAAPAWQARQAFARSTAVFVTDAAEVVSQSVGRSVNRSVGWSNPLPLQLTSS